MPGLVPGVHVFSVAAKEAVDGRGKPGHDGGPAICYTAVMIKTLEQAIAEVESLSAKDQEQIGRMLLSHVEKLRALREEVDKGIRSLDAGQGRESSVDDFLRQKNR